MREDWIDRIYEAAVLPELWPQVLEILSEVGGGLGGTLITASTDCMHWTASPLMREDLQAFIDGGWHLTNTRLPRLLARRHAGFLRDVDVYESMAELDDDPHIRDFFRPRGLGWVVGTAIPSPSGDMLVFSVERAYERGPVEAERLARLDALRPHLARAALLSARLGLQRARAIADILEAVGLPAAVLRGTGRLLAVNPSFERLLGRLAQEGLDRVHLLDAGADLLLREALARLALRGAAAPVSSIPVAGREDRPPLVVHALPVRGAANDLFGRATGILIVTPVDRKIVPDADLLAGLFDLTAAEARIARRIALGESPDEVAAFFGVSRETVRSQLKSVLAKTGLQRQSQLAAMLGGVGLP